MHGSHTCWRSAGRTPQCTCLTRHAQVPCSASFRQVPPPTKSPHGRATRHPLQETPCDGRHHRRLSKHGAKSAPAAASLQGTGTSHALPVGGTKLCKAREQPTDTTTDRPHARRACCHELTSACVDEEQEGAMRMLTDCQPIYPLWSAQRPHEGCHCPAPQAGPRTLDKVISRVCSSACRSLHHVHCPSQWKAVVARRAAPSRSGGGV